MHALSKLPTLQQAKFPNMIGQGSGERKSTQMRMKSICKGKQFCWGNLCISPSLSLHAGMEKGVQHASIDSGLILSIGSDVRCSWAAADANGST